MLLLSLDLSSKVGYCVANIDLDKKTFNIVESGTLKKAEKGDEKYPLDYYNWVKTCFQEVWFLIDCVNPTHIVIEETTPGRNALSQKFLDWLHYLTIEYILKKADKERELSYLMTGQWRKLIGLQQTKQDKELNKQINKIKKSTGEQVAKIDGKRVGKITKKHLSVRFANEKFGMSLKLKDNDQADAICIAYAEFTRLIK